MKNSPFTLVTAFSLIFIALGCSSQTATPTASSNEESPAAERTAAAPDFLTYDGPAEHIPITAQYPRTMQVMSAGSGEGVGVHFTFAAQGNALDGAELHVFLPSGAASAAESERFVTGPNGLMASNGWIPSDVEEGRSRRFPYGWVEKVINFSTDREQSGQVLLGQAYGQAVQVTLLYPAEMADAYWPAANAVLQSLQFDEDLLPIRSSNL